MRCIFLAIWARINNAIGQTRYVKQQSNRQTFLYGINKERPITGAATLVLAGLALAVVPFVVFRGSISFESFLTSNLAVQEPAIGLVVLASGVIAYILPRFSSYAGVLGIAASVLSLSGLTLGALGIGLVLGVIGGGYCVLWEENNPKIMISREFTTAITLSLFAFFVVVPASVRFSLLEAHVLGSPQVGAIIHVFAGGVVSASVFLSVYLLKWLSVEHQKSLIGWQTVFGGLLILSIISVSGFYIIYLQSTTPSVSASTTASMELNESEKEVRFSTSPYRNPNKNSLSEESINITVASVHDDENLAEFKLGTANSTAVLNTSGVTVHGGEVYTDTPIPEGSNVTVTVRFVEDGNSYVYQRHRYELYSRSY